MERVVSEDYGTIGMNFRGVKYSVAAKTGTAQANSNESDNAWFTGFAPVDNPKIAVTCLIENGASGSYASYTVRKVMDKYLVG